MCTDVGKMIDMYRRFEYSGRSSRPWGDILLLADSLESAVNEEEANLTLPSERLFTEQRNPLEAMFRARF